MAALNKINIATIADDLTGAADSIAPFAAAGAPAYVISSNDMADLPDNCHAIAFNTNTRDVAEHDFARVIWRTRKAMRAALKTGAPLLYKKVDSTLRGNLALELSIMREAVPKRIVIICSAYPANGRTVEACLLSIGGAFPQANRMNDNRSTVADAFGMGKSVEARSLDLNTVREGVAALTQTIDALENAGKHVLFADAITQDDLAILAGVICNAPTRFLPVGSAGLSREIARCLGNDPFSTVFSACPSALRSGRVLVIVGTQHDVSTKQAKALAAHTGAPTISMHSARDTVRAAALVQSQFAAGQRVVLVTASESVKQGFTAAVFGSMLRRLLVSNGQQGFEPLDLKGVIVTGGDTALHVLDALDSRRWLRILGEIEPGVVIAEFAIGSAQLPFLILKSGGFGRTDSLLRWVGFLG